jgi:ubiquinone/menaquinone biosynthesis C-methylase UbiE
MRELLYHLLVPAIRWFNRGVRAVSATTHMLQYKAEGVLRPAAEWFDHQLDAQYQWPRFGRTGFVERGVLSALTLQRGGSVLELCCGDGFSTRHFYAPKAGRVVAVDANPSALAHARTFNAVDNVRYEQCDITRALPDGPFDNVVWDTAIHHFTRDDATAILRRVASVLTPEGALSGHTVIEPGSHYVYQLQSFHDATDLAELLANVFPHVCVRTTTDALRTDLFFFAGLTPGALPFDASRDDVTIIAREHP